MIDNFDFELKYPAGSRLAKIMNTTKIIDRYIAEKVLTQVAEEARREEREAWLKGNRCAVCGDSNIGSGGLSDLCSNCVETQ